jgi:hypothetical protein
MDLCPLPGELFPEQRWFAATRPVFGGRRVVVLSSRIGRDLQRRAHWFDRLNRLLNEFAVTDRTVLSCPGATCHPYLQYGGSERGLRGVECQLPAARQTFGQWTRWVVNSDEFADDLPRLAVSPPAEQAVNLTRGSGDSDPRKGPDIPARWPLADRLLATLGEELYVMFVRPGGNLEQIVSHHLCHPPAWLQRWMLAVEPESIAPALAERWIQQGAIAWTWSSVPSVGNAARTITAQPCRDRAAGIVPLSSVACDRYLAHWTRCQPGPWPGESESEYVQSLLLNPSARDRSALATLLRIVGMRRLIGTNRLTRGETKVVCFTARPLTSFTQRRTFRPMHARWDFEPYGLCIDRHWLSRHGARAVIYGDEATWQHLAEADRPFFQHRGSNSGPSPCDWTEEHEWRHPGDIDLRRLLPSQGLLFVPDAQSATQLSAVSPWPVTIIG